MEKKKRKAITIILLSREESSSGKTLQAVRASFTSCSSDSSIARKVKGIPVAFIYYTTKDAYGHLGV